MRKHRQNTSVSGGLSYGEVAALYYELLMQVQYKIPGETRHETAKRILRQSQECNNQPEAKSP